LSWEALDPCTKGDKKGTENWVEGNSTHAQKGDGWRTENQVGGNSTHVRRGDRRGLRIGLGGT